MCLKVLSIGYQFSLGLPLHKGTYDKGVCSFTTENVSVSEFIGTDLKGLLLETPTGDQPALTACDNFSKYEIQQPHILKKTLTLRVTLHSLCWPSAILFVFLHWIILGLQEPTFPSYQISVA